MVDNDAPTVFVRYLDGVSGVTFNEGEMVELIAELQNAPNGATEDLTVSLAARAIVGGATDSGTADDVGFVPSTVVISARASKATFAVRAVTNDLAEFNERVNIYVSDVAYGVKNRDPGDDGAELTIVNKDLIVATLEVLDSPADLKEGITTTIRIKLNQQLPDRTPDRTLSLVLQDTDSKYVRIDNSQDITADLKNSQSTDVKVELTDNMCLINVMAELRLQMAPALMPLLPTGASTSFNIIENDPGTVSVSLLDSATRYNEGDSVQAVVELESGITACTPISGMVGISGTNMDEDGNQLAPAGTSDGLIASALGLAPGFAQGLALPVRGLAQVIKPVVIPIGENRVILTIQLTDDMTAEETELLELRLMGVDAGPNARVEVDQRMDETVITILDNEDPVLEILGSGSVNEEDGRYIVRLRRLGRIDTNGEKVPFTISGDAGDFVGKLGGEFVFDGLDALSQLVILTLDDDRSQEDAKTFQIEVERLDPMTNMFVSVDLVDPVTGMPASGFAVTLLDTDVADFFGVLPATGGPVLPIWLVLLLALTGIALLVPTLRRLN